MTDNVNMATVNDEALQDGNVTVERLLSFMEKIANDTAHLKEAMEAMRSLSSIPDEEGHAAAAQGIAKIVASREETNQQMLKLCGRMYDGLTERPECTAEANKRMIFSELVRAMREEEETEARLDMFNMIFNKLDLLESR